MLNHVELLGRLAQEPEIRLTANGTPVASFDLAVPVYSRDGNTPPDYIPIVCWDQKADFVERYLSKGRQIVVEGRVKTRKYTDKAGNNRKAIEIHATNVYFADSNHNEEKNSYYKNGGNVQNGNDFPPEAENPQDTFQAIDEDVPF